MPLIDAAGGLGGLASLLKSSDKFISAAVATAVKNNYSGYDSFVRNPIVHSAFANSFVKSGRA
eukprot:COSAG02_NODE_9583_length_2169_cov_3.441546_2_plen_63_part_00